MAKSKRVFTCQACGFQSPKWQGRCPECGEWNTFIEEQIVASASRQSVQPPQSQPTPLGNIAATRPEERISTGIPEFDRVLGGGLFPASVILLAGEPGIGKSTLLLQVLLALQASGKKTLYVTGEESLQQVRNRAVRLPQNDDSLLILSETVLPDILYHIEHVEPEIVVMDSVQSMYHPDLSGSPGNLSQVRECTAQLFTSAKTRGFTLILIGHVTKEGSVAGPKTLEHLVDVVISFESNALQHRILRGVKNRFGPAQELGVFEMTANGLQQVKDLSGLFLSAHSEALPGSSIVCSFEGSRPLLAEVQALVSRANYGTPQRTVSGFDYRRLTLILAILEKHTHINFGISDVFVKVAGGFRINDPGIDLGVAAAIYSSHQELALDNDAVYIGEVGLGGEVRPVTFTEPRLREISKMGFKQAYLPAPSLPATSVRKSIKLMLSPVNSIKELFR